MASSPGLAERASRSSPLQHRFSPAALSVTTPPTKSSPTAPDVESPIHERRMIRPMPKRRLRDRLSLEQRDGIEIEMPKGMVKQEPLFRFPLPGVSGGPVPGYVSKYDGESTPEPLSGDEKDESVFAPSRVPQGSKSRGQRLSGAQKLPTYYSTLDSGGSSVEEETFETNNKKKRKIPQSNGMGGHHSSLSADMANMGIAPRDQPDSSLPPEHSSAMPSSYYGTPSAMPPPLNTGGPPVAANGAPTSAGASRGKFGRNGRGSLERRPLGASTNGLNYGNMSPGGRMRAMGKAVSTSSSTHNSPQSAGALPGNIIGSAIARSKEASLSPNFVASPKNLQAGEHSPASVIEPSKPPTGPFTFTHQPPTETHWPGQGPYSMEQGYAMPGAYPDGKRLGVPPPPGQAPMQNQGSSSSHQSGQAGMQQGPPPPPQDKKPRRQRRPGRVYEIVARQRRLTQEYENYHAPPEKESFYICSFCEYESIYGRPPEALIKLYEIKDRKEHKKKEERRRLLEKAKNKGRKGKKGSKNAAANQPPAPGPAPTPAQAQAMKNTLAYQAAEFQKKEMLRAHAEMDKRAEEERQRLLEEQRFRGDTVGGAEYEGDEEYDDDGLYDEDRYEYEDEGGEHEHYDGHHHPYPDDELTQRLLQQPGVTAAYSRMFRPPPHGGMGSAKGKERRVDYPPPPPPTEEGLPLNMGPVGVPPPKNRPVDVKPVS